MKHIAPSLRTGFLGVLTFAVVHLQTVALWETVYRGRTDVPWFSNSSPAYWVSCVLFFVGACLSVWLTCPSLPQEGAETPSDSPVLPRWQKFLVGGVIVFTILINGLSKYVGDAPFLMVIISPFFLLMKAYEFAIPSMIFLAFLGIDKLFTRKQFTGKPAHPLRPCLAPFYLGMLVCMMLIGTFAGGSEWKPGLNGATMLALITILPVLLGGLLAHGIRRR